MNSEVVKQTGQVATNTISALQNQPLVLGLIVLQVIVLGTVLYSSIARQTAISAQFKTLYALLEKCMLERGKP
jgi:hypothetical protein